MLAWSCLHFQQRLLSPSLSFFLLQEAAQHEAVQRLRHSFQLPFPRLADDGAQPSGAGTLVLRNRRAGRRGSAGMLGKRDAKRRVLHSLSKQMRSEGQARPKLC